MAAAGFTVTRSARRATRIGGRLGANEKAVASRRARRAVRVQVHVDGTDADVVPAKLWTDWDVI